jgi:hypothetical protein
VLPIHHSEEPIDTQANPPHLIYEWSRSCHPGGLDQDDLRLHGSDNLLHGVGELRTNSTADTAIAQFHHTVNVDPGEDMAIQVYLSEVIDHHCHASLLQAMLQDMLDQ